MGKGMKSGEKRERGGAGERIRTKMISYRSTIKSEGAKKCLVPWVSFFLLGGESHARDKVWDKNNICVKIIRAQ